jgi:hypothetical protein
MTEEQIIRYVYIDFGKKMNFDLRYTFGNKKTRNIIYERIISESETEKILQDRISICKGMSILLQNILNEFGINCRTEKLKGGVHMYNVVTLKNGREYELDLEEDLQYIQSGSKTKYFGKPFYFLEDKQMMIPEEIKEFDTNVIKYIPEGLYLEDMAYLLKKAIGNENTNLETKVDLLLENLEVYRDMHEVSFRERIRSQIDLMRMVLSPKDLNKVHQITFFKKLEDGEYDAKSCVYIDLSKNKKFYKFIPEESKYVPTTLEEVAKLVEDGFNYDENIPGLKKYIHNNKNPDEELR